MLILIVGLPGTGKTSLAMALALKLDLPHLNSDKIRISMGKTGQYDDASKATIYLELLKQTETLLHQEQSVIVDATLYKELLRKPYLALGDKYHTPVHIIEVKAHDDIILNRMRQPRKYSEADFEVYKRIKAIYEPLNTSHLTIQTDQLTLDQSIKKILEYI